MTDTNFQSTPADGRCCMPAPADQICELTLDEAWAMIRDVADAVLIDVRTVQEWADVGRPDLSSIAKSVRFVEWLTMPEGHLNPCFLEEAVVALKTDQPILLICRSGVRSLAAARALRAAGFTAAHNVSDGFEGDLDDAGQRTGGWKGADLPWLKD